MAPRRFSSTENVMIGPFDYETLVLAIQEQIGGHGSAAVA
jgi:hypothetical protein